AIQPSEPVVIDLWPSDFESACFADMTRTFVVGEAPAELRKYHELTRESLSRSLAAVRPGVAGKELHRLSCEPYERAGLPTQLSKAPGQVLEEGYFHSLGHGVGLEVHEAPLLRRGRTCWWPATSSRSSPVAIAPASADAGSRISCS
ncbi:MAG: aminopeptidase P family protein, partial [Solirubrobacterales bacterium]|nr:aminopeptidase P family protein [Solirubrobacterales bacterium]